MKKLLIPFIVLLLSIDGLKAQNIDKIVEGIVFFDEDSDGIKGEYEKGMADIVVTDGFTVVKTDKKGKFKIALSPRSRFVTVSTPSGYTYTNSYFADVRNWVSGEDTNEYFGEKRVKRGLFYQKGEGVYFPLKAVVERGKFIQMGDIEERTYRTWFSRLAEFIENHSMDFMAMTGDICYEKGLKLNSKEITDEKMGTRVVFTLGNHDLIKGSTDYLGNPYGEKLYEDCFGPTWYSFNISGVHFVVTPMLFGGDAKPSYSRDDVMDWLEKDVAELPEGTPVVFFNHAMTNGIDLPKYNIKDYIYGHNHNNYYHRDSLGIDFYCTIAPNKAGVDHSPSSIRMFTIEPNGELISSLYYTPLTNHIATKAVSCGEDSVEIVAIVYDAASDVENVRIVGKEGMKPLDKVNDMIWRVKMSAREKDHSYVGKEYRAGALFSDGETVFSNVDLRDDFLWIKTLPAKVYMADPLIVGDTIFLAGIDDCLGRDCGVYAIDKNSGEPLWFFHTINSVKNDIVYKDGVIYAADMAHNVYALDAHSGSQIWHKKVYDTFFPLFTEGLCLEDGKLFVGSNSFLCALDALTGEKVWENNKLTSGVNNVSTRVVADGVLLTNNYWVCRSGFDAATGELLWNRKTIEDRYCSSSPIYLDGHFIYTTQNGIMEVDAKTGEEIQFAAQNEQFATASRPLLCDSIIIVGTSDNGVVAYNRKDFSRRWGASVSPSLIYTFPYSSHFSKTVESDPIRYGDDVIFGANDGFIYCMGINKGEYKWRINIGLPIVATPALEGDYLYVVDFSGTIYKIDLTKVTK